MKIRLLLLICFSSYSQLFSIGGFGLNLNQGIYSVPETSDDLIVLDQDVGNIVHHGLNNGYGGRMVLRRSISGGSTGDLINFRGTPTGNRPIVTKSFNDHKSQSNESYSYYNVPIHALDQPNTTSAVTYSIRIGSYGGADVHINRSGAFQDGGGGGSDGLSNGTDAYDGITVCTMTLMEVSS